jgi:hypothetical protein
MSGRIPARAKRLSATLLAAGACLAVSASVANAAMIYNNIPAGPLAGNLPSVGFEATKTSEFGGEVGFSNARRTNPSVAVVMSSWACEQGSWTWPSSGSKCQTVMGATFSQAVTLNIYAVGPGNAVGALLKTATQTFAMPYRPSASRYCVGSSAGDYIIKNQCYHGKVFKITFENLGVTLPTAVIIGVAYNTSDYGVTPQRPQPCNSQSGGCPYDSLNVAVREATESYAPTAGSDPLPESVFINSQTAGNYCENPGGVNTFAESKNCWTGEQPVFEVYKTTL